MTTLSGIHHIGIVVESIEASAAWYIDKLGFERLYTFAFPGVQAAFIGRGDLKIELFRTIRPHQWRRKDGEARRT